MIKFNKLDLISIANRAFALASGLAMVIMNVHYVQVSGQGEIALINFGILITTTISQLVGGGALIFLAKKYHTSKFHLPTIVWVVISACITGILSLLLHFPYILEIITLGILQSVVIYIQMLQLAQGKISSYQLQLFSQAAFTPLFVFLFYSLGGFKVHSFIFGLSASLCITLLLGVRSAIDKTPQPVGSSFQQKDLIKDFFHFGGFNQLANLAHLGNQRIYIYLLEALLHQGYLLSGIFSIYLYIAEAIWTVTKSLSSILASQIAQSNEHTEHKSLFAKYIQLSMIGTVVLCSLALIFPKNFLTSYLNMNSDSIQMGLWLMIPAIVAHSITVPISHLFSGLGLMKNNFYSALIGMTGGLISGLLLIPNMNMNGALISLSIGFISQCFIQLIFLRKWYQSKSNKSFTPKALGT
jgi:O-antigen/teichoic acid export membrane protein